MDFKYEVVKEIGKGAFGAVYRVKSEDYALKLVYVKNKDELDAIKREVQVHSKLNHDNVVKYIDYSLISSSYNSIIKLNHMFQYQAFVLLIELCNTTLAEELQIRCQVDDLLNIKAFKQILNGVDYLHSNNPPVVHRDLKPQNILVKFKNSDFCVKISDFGFSKDIQNGLIIVHSKTTGTLGYSAPEQKGGEICSTAVDIFSLGIILIELYTIMPFNLWIEDFWKNKKLPIIQQNVESYVRHMTQLDAQKRPTAKEILRTL
jgi:serine/threonine protein kinase